VEPLDTEVPNTSVLILNEYINVQHLKIDFVYLDANEVRLVLRIPLVKILRLLFVNQEISLKEADILGLSCNIKELIPERS
jgi:hypothetical protein